MKNNISTMLKCTMFVSLCIILGKVFVFKMPFGGSINLSPIPIVLSSIMFGPLWGAYTGFTYSIVKIILGFQVPPVVNPISIIGVAMLDYVIPYTALGGLSSTFKFKGKTSMYLSALPTMTVRLLSTSISGVIIWKSLLFTEVNVFVYSLVYNATYVIPETIIYLILCPIILDFLKYKKENLK